MVSYPFGQRSTAHRVTVLILVIRGALTYYLSPHAVALGNGTESFFFCFSLVGNRFFFSDPLSFCRWVGLLVAFWFLVSAAKAKQIVMTTTTPLEAVC